MVDWGLEGGRKKGKKQAEEAARTLPTVDITNTRGNSEFP